MPRAIDERVQRARSFRKNPTDAERKLWQHLRQLPHSAVHFRRQATIGKYFADFACHSTRLIVELDGGQHGESASDTIRTAYLNANGYRVLRFWNNDVLFNIEGVLQMITDAVNAPPTPDPSPPREECVGGGESAAYALPSLRPCGGDATGEDARAVGSGMGGTGILPSDPSSKDGTR